MEYTKNLNPAYFEEFPTKANCGSFAFNIEEWYDPIGDEYFSAEDRDEWIREMYNNDYSLDELADMYVEELTEQVLKDFNLEIRLITHFSEVQSNEEVIALRAWCYYSEDDWSDWDFHFKVLRDGIWQEKCGCESVRFCLKDEWSYGTRTYNSETIYFAHRVI